MKQTSIEILTQKKVSDDCIIKICSSTITIGVEPLIREDFGYENHRSND